MKKKSNQTKLRLKVWFKFQEPGAKIQFSYVVRFYDHNGIPAVELSKGRRMAVQNVFLSREQCFLWHRLRRLEWNRRRVAREGIVDKMDRLVQELKESLR